jgi:hypothetical protein
VVLHVITAIALVLHSVSVANSARRLAGALRSPANWLVVLILCQFVLGLATWRAKYGWPSFVPMVAETSADRPMEIAFHNALVGQTVRSESMAQAITVTSHVALGSLILAIGVCYATRASRAYGISNSTRSSSEPATVSRIVITNSTVALGGAMS